MDVHRCFSSRKRKQVRRACLNCQKAHSGCGEQRPCPRCVKRKEEHKCVDAPRRKRKEDEPNSPPCITACEAAATPSFNNKRKRKLSTSNPTTPPALSLAVKTERNASFPRREIRSDDDDYEDLQDQDYDGSSSYTAAALVKNTKRPRRQRWQPAFGGRNATLPFPFDAVKGERSGSSGSEEEEEEEYACEQQHNHQNALGPMDLRQQHLITQKFSTPHLQQPSQRHVPMTTPNPTPATSNVAVKKETSPEEGGSTFLFNLQEFDCVAPPGRQTVQLPVSATPHAATTTATPPGSDDEFSLDWLLPGAYPWPATSTTATTPAMAPFWGPDLPSSVVLSGEDTYGVSEEDAPFFYPDRTFEPLFSF